MSLVAELHNAHKTRQHRIAVAAEALKSRKRAEAETAQIVAPEDHCKAQDEWIEAHNKYWFSIISSANVCKSGAPTIRTIQRAVCDVYGVKMNDLLSARRTWDIVLPRHVSMYLAKELTGLSYPRIGRATGDRDHTVGIYAYKKIKSLIGCDPKLAANVSYLISILTGASE